MPQAQIATAAQRAANLACFVVMVDSQLNRLRLTADNALAYLPRLGKRNNVAHAGGHASRLSVLAAALLAPRIQAILLASVLGEEGCGGFFSLAALSAGQQFHARLAFRKRLSGSAAASGHIFI